MWLRNNELATSVSGLPAGITRVAIGKSMGVFYLSPLILSPPGTLLSWMAPRSRVLFFNRASKRFVTSLCLLWNLIVYHCTVVWQ
jgi:hypothetical protein